MTKHPDASLLEEWLDGYASKTRSAYETDWNAFLAELGKKRLGKVGEQDVAAFLDKASTPAIRRRRLGVIKTFYVHAIGQKLFLSNPAAGLSNPKASWQPRSYRSVDEKAVRDMLSTADKIRDKVLLQLIYTCALSADEILELTWSDVETDKAQTLLHVPGLHARSLPLTASDARDLAKLRGGREDTQLVMESRLGDGLSKRQLNRIVGEMGEAIGVPEVTVGRLRNAYAQHALAAGVRMDEVHHKLGNRSYNSTASQFRALSVAGKSTRTRKQAASDVTPLIAADKNRLRDADFVREVRELAELDAASKTSPAQRKRRNFLRGRLAAEMDRRYADGEALPPGHENLSRNVPLNAEQIDILSELLEEAGTVMGLRVARAGEDEERIFYRKKLPKLKELIDLLDRSKPHPGPPTPTREE